MTTIIVLLYSFRSKLDSPGAINSASNTNALHNYWQNTNNLTWQKQFGDHSFTAMGVWEISRSWDSQLKGTGSNLNNESVGYWNLGNAAIRDASNSYTEFSLASGIVRANYDYKKRYFITAALRNSTVLLNFRETTNGDIPFRSLWLGILHKNLS